MSKYHQKKKNQKKKNQTRKYTLTFSKNFRKKIKQLSFWVPTSELFLEAKWRHEALNLQSQFISPLDKVVGQHLVTENATDKKSR